MTRCAPALAEPQDPAAWLERPGAPRPARVDDEVGRTMPYMDAASVWRAAPG
jgi:glycerol transport system substrate-binding protein